MRAQTERLFWAVCGKVQRIIRELAYVPEELQGLVYQVRAQVYEGLPAGHLFAKAQTRGIGEKERHR